MAIFYRISTWLDHLFSSGFAGIEIFTYIQVCDVPAKLINYQLHKLCLSSEMQI